MSETSVSSQSTWRSKIKAMGPGILMASAAVGGSHIVSSTQAGGSYGWALLGLVILANLFKYPFFRFGAEYTADTGKTLVEGYAEKGKFYLWVFFILNVFSALVNTAGVSILCSAIIASAFPMLGLSITTWSIILVAIIWGMLLFGGYKLLDGMAKWIMSAFDYCNSSSSYLLRQSNTQSTVLTSLKKHHGSSQPFHLSFHFLDGCQHQLKFQPLTHFGQLRKRKLLISTLMMPSLTLTLVTSEQLFLRYSL